MIIYPGMDGFETYRKIIEISPRQKSIIASRFTETDKVRETQRLGAGEYIKKPYSIIDIGKAIKFELNKNSKPITKRK